MKPHHKPWILASISLVILWSGVAVVLHVTDERISNPQKTLELMRASPWLTGVASAATRAEHIEKVIANVNMLDFPQRTEMRDEGSDTIKKFFDSLTKDEQKHYVDLTVQKAFDAVIKGFKAMGEEERKRTITNVRRNIRANRSGEEAQKRADEDQKLFDEFVDIGVEEYLKSASTEEKMKLAPAIEDMQTRIRGVVR